MSAGEGRASRQNDSVLIVDDDAAMRESLREVLQDQGYDVLVAKDGSQALRELQDRRRKICVVLLDLVMPVMDGRELLTVKARDKEIRDIPVILFTGHEAEPFRMQGGVAAVIAKGMKMEILIDAVRHLCAAPIA